MRTKARGVLLVVLPFVAGLIARPGVPHVGPPLSPPSAPSLAASAAFGPSAAYAPLVGRSTRLGGSSTGASRSAAGEVQYPPGSTGYLWSGASCGSAAECELVGTYLNTASSQPAMVVDTFAGGRWGPLTSPPPPASMSKVQVNDVSCPSAVFCVAVGAATVGTSPDPLVVTLTNKGWQFSALSPAGGVLSHVSCPTATWCLAVGTVGSSNQSLTETLSSGRWTSGSSTPQINFDPVSLSCPAPQVCMLASIGPGSVEMLSGGRWSLQPGWGAALGGQVNAVSCSSPALCMVVGTDNSGGWTAAIWSSGEWRSEPLPAPAGTSPVMDLTAVTCTAPEVCFAAGYYEEGGGADHAVWEEEVNGLWTVLTGVDYPGFSSTKILAGSCSGLTLCVLFGTGTTSRGEFTWYEANLNWFREGFWTAASGGAVYAAGSAPTLGYLPATAADPVVGLAGSPDGRGYWEVTREGAVRGFGDAGYYSDLPSLRVSVDDIVAIAPTTDGRGYWLIGADGGMFAFGDAKYHGSLPGLGMHVHDIVGVVAAPSGGGYVIVGADGGVFVFGAAHYYGSLPGLGIHVSDIVGILPSPAGTGYALVGADGGVFNFGTGASYYGSLPGEGVHVSDIVGLALTPDAHGYWLAGSNGAIYSFGDAEGLVASVPYGPVAAISGAA